MPDANGNYYWWEQATLAEAQTQQALRPGARTGVNVTAQLQNVVQRYYEQSVHNAILYGQGAIRTAWTTRIIDNSPPVEQEVDSEVERIKLINDFKVGADPEWILLGAKGELVVPDLPAAGQVGTDHGGRILELRPTASRSCLRLVQNMQRLLNSPRLEKWRSPKWRAGGVAKYAGRQESLGGHVHLGLTFNANYHGLSAKELERHLNSSSCYYDSSTGSYRAIDVEKAQELLKVHARSEAAIAACDKLTTVFEELDILPQKEASERRRGGHGYGRLGDVRESSGHLEYRTPVSWLFSPTTAYFTLTGYKLAAAQPEGFDVASSAKSFRGDWAYLRDVYRRFAPYDNDAARCAEKLYDHSQVQGDPDCDFKDLWSDPKLGGLK